LILRILANFIITIFILATIVVGPFVFSVSASDMNSNLYEELRDNLVEVRLALQKGDLTEALQHLNNAEQQLLLLAENSAANSTIS
jgi:hypothetical protein